MKQQIEERIKVLETQQKELAQKRQQAQSMLQQFELKLIGIAEAIKELKAVIAEPETEVKPKNKTK